MSKNTTAKAKEIQAKADKIEALLSNPKSSKALHYALGGLLIELSNESQTSVDFPGVAGAFYRQAVNQSAEIEPQHWALKACLRHLDALLSNPNAKTANAIMEFWEAPASMRPDNDPFPARKAKGGRHAST